MQELSFTENELTGARLTVPFTALKHFGPKHHAVIVGVCDDDQDLWIAELSRSHGYRLVSMTQWLDDNRPCVDEVKIEPNPGPRSNREVADSAIHEVRSAAEDGLRYNVVFNNCETFANRHITGTTTLSPQIKKAAEVLGFVAVSGVLILKQRLNKK